MTVHKAVRRLHNDLHRLHKAEHEQKADQKDLRGDKKALKQDRKALKQDRRQGDRLHDRFDDNKKDLTRTVDQRQKQLQAIAEQRATATAIDDVFDPTTGTTAPGELEQAALAALDQKEAAVHAKFDGRIDQGRARGQSLRDAIHAKRDELKKDRKDIKHDRKVVKHDHQELAHDRNAVKHARHTALEHLRPAEYHMGLKGTNRVRQDLGLKKVDHVIRPGVEQVVGGQVGKWIAQAQTILKQHGIPLSKMSAKDINIIIQHESGGNPNAYNGWDSNAAAGTPSIGLMQTIGPTFDSYKLPGHGNIRNPIDNIIAGVRYAITRYGSISNVPGVRAVHSGGAYVGY